MSGERDRPFSDLTLEEVMRLSPSEAANWLRERPLPDQEPEPEFTSCEHPGRNGCQECDACLCWGDDEYHRQKER